MRTQRLSRAAALIGPTAALALLAAGVGRAASQVSVVSMKDARIKFEINATDGDGGVQVFLDAEPWRRMSIFDPSGRLVFTATAKGRFGDQGGTELFLESGEPAFSDLPLDQLLERFPAGEYRFRARGIDGETHVGAARLTHDLPDGPRLLSPLAGDGPQDPRATILRWEQVEDPNSSPIVGYQVLVVQPDSRIRAIPKVTLDVMMPPDATSLAVPAGFLRPGTDYEWEVLAIEAGGNQTLSSSTFTTAGTSQRDAGEEPDTAEDRLEDAGEGGPELPITGSDLQRATQVALAHLGGGRVTGTEVEDEESYYEIEMTLDDGRRVDVQLDEGFRVVGTGG